MLVGIYDESPECHQQVSGASSLIKLLLIVYYTTPGLLLNLSSQVLHLVLQLLNLPSANFNAAVFKM